MIQTALLFVLTIDSMNRERWYTSAQQLQETSLRVCEAVRGLSRAKLFGCGNTPHTLLMGVGGEALPAIDGLAMERACQGSECCVQ